MLTNTKPCNAILLSLIVFLSFLGCDRMENETTSYIMGQTSPSQSLLKSNVVVTPGVTTSTTGFPMIDLGVLDYPYVHFAFGVNNLGNVVGQVGTESGQHAFLWSKQIGLKDLGALGDPDLWMDYEEWAYANDINELGQVVGSSWEPWTTIQRAFLWSDKGGMVSIGTLGDYGENSFSMGFGINILGEIVGVTDNCAFIWTERHGMILLSTLKPEWKWGGARDINDKGWIVGMSQLPPPEPNPQIPWTWKPDQFRAVLWTNENKTMDIGTIGLNSQALGINNQGEVVGGSSNLEGWSHERIGSLPNGNGYWFDHSCVAFIWTEKNGMVKLPLLGGDAGCAHAINDRGQVVGWSYKTDDKVHAYVWTSKNGIKDLGTLPGDVESVAYGINNHGQVVGYSKSGNGINDRRHAVIWTVK